MYWALAKSLGLAKLSREDAQRIMDAAVAAVPHEKKRRDTADLHAGVKTLREVLRARTGHAAHNLAVLKHITLNLIRLDPTPRKGGIKVRRLIAATSDLYRAQLLGLA